MDEALRRAEAYHAAGADAILIHSKRSTATEILTFADHWQQRCPLVIVPTMYHSTPTEVFHKAGISNIIWANHNLRASISAMREASRQIFESQSLGRIESRVASVRDIFQLVGNAELEAAEKRYLPARATAKAIVLAASGGDLGEMTSHQPKCMVDIRGQPLLQRLADALSHAGIREISVVRGYAKETVTLSGIQTIDNDRYTETGEVYSLSRAGDRIDGETIVVYGDVLFRNHILTGLMSMDSDIVLAVDALGAKMKPPGRIRDLVTADHGFSGHYLDDRPAFLKEMSSGIAPENISGEWIGLARFSKQGSVWLREEMAALAAEGLLASADMPLLLTRLSAKHPVAIHYVLAHWLDVDTVIDVGNALNFV